MISVSALRKAMREISSKKGPFTLFGLFRRSDSPGTWDLVVSAPWLEDGKLRALGKFVGLLTDSIGEQAFRDFSRVQTVGEDNPALRKILKSFSVDDGEVRVTKSNLFGLEIEDAIILRAQRPSLSTAGTRTAANGSGH